MILQNALNEFLINQEIKGNSKRTIEFYSLNLGYFLAFLGPQKSVDGILLTDLNNYYIDLKKRDICSVTLQTYIRALRTFLNWCYDEEYHPLKLPDRFKLPKAEKKIIDVLSDYEIESLFSLFNPRSFLELRNLCICALMLDCGLRKNEVVTMAISRFRGTDGFIIVNGKGSIQRVVPLGLKTRKYLSKYVALRPCLETDFLFLTNDNRPITQNTIKQLFSRLKEDSGIKRLHPHLLRHTFATLFIQNGGDVFTLQQLLGHSTLDMSKKYLHLGVKNSIEKYKSFSPLDNMKKQP